MQPRKVTCGSAHCRHAPVVAKEPCGAVLSGELALQKIKKNPDYGLLTPDPQTTMLLLLLLIGGSYGQDLLTPVEAVPTPDAPEELNLRNDTPEPSDSDSESEEPREGKSIASPIPPPLAHPPPVPGAIFRDSPVVHPVPHDAPLAAGPPPPPLAGGPPPPPAAPIFHDSPVVHPAPPPPPPPAPEPVYTDRKCRIEQIELLAEVSKVSIAAILTLKCVQLSIATRWPITLVPKYCISC